jgi:hypothetical protein
LKTFTISGTILNRGANSPTSTKKRKTKAKSESPRFLFKTKEKSWLPKFIDLLFLLGGRGAQS